MVQSWAHATIRLKLLRLALAAVFAPIRCTNGAATIVVVMFSFVDSASRRVVRVWLVSTYICFSRFWANNHEVLIVEAHMLTLIFKRSVNVSLNV